MTPLSRRSVLLATLALTACGRGAAPTRPKGPLTLADAVAGAWRTPADKARDAWRHPVESLTFWGLRPGMTVVEFWPGAGWYTEILAPYLASTGGKLYAADLETADPANAAARQVVAAYRKRLEANPKLYGKVATTAFGPRSGPVAPPASADLALFLRNLHDWMAAGVAEKAFHDAFAALKPGGILGVEEHRADPAGVPDPLAADGYVDQAYVVKLAQEAGFVLDATSEINANPKDTKDHPFGVWTLPPVRRSSPIGKPPNPGFDHAKYDAIGESDRMTLRFVKPASAHA
ncbi:methyltransferase [Phenylobacterium sp.]|uniref:class I SAM-dependent methyltransferase n=1 Tax=Phenylobacterium sp. TaxID=1871053 RepID=UPI002DE7647C|nr:methyltransferase [Phenylobacterium sp.]